MGQTSKDYVMNYKETLINTQKGLAAEILGRIHNAFDPSAVIAGGAPRDWDMGRLANDIDIYIDSSTMHKFSDASIRKEIFPHEEFRSMNDWNYKSGEIVDVFQGWIEGQCVQFVFVSCEPKDAMHYFAATISQAYYDGKDIVKSAIKEALDEKEVMLMHESGSIDYCRKIFKRFPGWDCSFPECYEIEDGDNLERVHLNYFIAGTRLHNSPQDVWHWKQGKPGECLAENITSADAYDFIRGLVMLDKGIDIKEGLTVEDVEEF